MRIVRVSDTNHYKNMQYTKLQDGYLVKVERGEELIETVTAFCAEQKIHSGSITGVGATDDVCLYYFDGEKKEYIPKIFNERDYEIISLTGNIALIDGTPFLHIHTALGDHEYQVFGGHLKSAVISVTGEVVISQIGGDVHRAYDEVCGLNLLDLK